MNDGTENKPQDTGNAQKFVRDPVYTANMISLEICFLAIIGLVVVAAFFEALNYELVSSRTPFVILAPLFLLIVIQGKRLSTVWKQADFSARVRVAFSGGLESVNKVVMNAVWMCALLLVVLCLGHYVGILSMGVIMMRWMAKTKFVTAVLVAGITTLLIFVVFEVGFGVDLYRGLLFRYLSGYRDF